MISHKTVIIVAGLSLSVFAMFLPFHGYAIQNANIHISIAVTGTQPPFIAAIDTMKESRDTQTRPLSDTAIAQDVQLSASVHATHITVDTNWDYSDYFRKWVKAIHAAGKNVWVRGHANQWENDNGVVGTMTPAMYLAYEKNFILQNADIFQPGDIFDTCSETEQGHYWKSNNATWNASTTAEYNQFIRDSIDVADAAFARKGVNGVSTRIHSTNAWIAIHRLEKETIRKMGIVTIDSYPDQFDTTVSQAVTDRRNDISAVYAAVQVPIVLGEIGYSNKIQVSDQLQEQVLQAEFATILQLSYVVGVNYWVGAGGPGHGGFTNIFTGSAGKWELRPAASDLENLFLSENTLSPASQQLPSLSPMGYKL